MVKKVFIPLLIVFLLLGLVGFFVKKYQPIIEPTKTDPKTQQKIVTIGTKDINIEIANSNESREKGLSGRTTLSENNGMLFVFDQKPIMVNFWMKDMYMPIDIIWIKDNKISKIDSNVPYYPPDTPVEQLKVYNPPSPIDYVLEVNSGFSNKYDFKVGDSVILPAL